MQSILNIIFRQDDLEKNIPLADSQPCTSNNIDEIDDMDKSSDKLFPSSSNSSEESIINKPVNLKLRRKLLNNLLLNKDKQRVFPGFFNRLIHFEKDHNLEDTDI